VQGSSSSWPDPSSKERSFIFSITGWSRLGCIPAQFGEVRNRRRAESAQVAPDEQLDSPPLIKLLRAGPNHFSEAAYRSARRRSQVPEGGTRTRSSHMLTPLVMTLSSRAARGSPCGSSCPLPAACAPWVAAADICLAV